MMSDTDYQSLQIRASVTPSAESWPQPDFSTASIKGDKPTLGDSGELFWVALRAAVDEARERVLKTMGTMAAINEDKALSATGREEKRQAAASKAVAAFESSTKLKQARDAVERKVAEWDKELFKAIKAPETLSESVVQTEIRAHLAAMTDNRLAFLDKHATDPQVVAAVFGGPPFLSGLSDADVATFKMLVARRTNPTLAKARDDALTALTDCERGHRNALRAIRECGGLKRDDNGGAA
jgi:hypothetical protein